MSRDDESHKDSPTWIELDAIADGKSKMDLAERIWQLELAARSSNGRVRAFPKTRGLLLSVALRMDHGLMVPRPGETAEQHLRRIEVATEDAERAYEEITGSGFYRPELENMYTDMVAQSPTRSEKGK